MTIKPLWIVCLSVRFGLLPLIIYLSKKKDYIVKTTSFILLLIGIGFIYKYITRSNNKIQVGKVFWLETRLIHGVLYILSSYYLYINNPIMSMLTLLLDPIFSIVYRVYTNQ